MSPLERIVVSQESVNDAYVRIVECYFQNADKVTPQDKIVSVVASKSVIDVYASTEGYILYYVQEGDEVPIGGNLADIYPSLPELRQVTLLKSPGVASPVNPSQGVIFSKTAKELMTQNKIPPDVFSDKTFVTGQDVRNYLETRS